MTSPLEILKRTFVKIQTFYFNPAIHTHVWTNIQDDTRRCANCDVPYRPERENQDCLL